MPDTGATHGDMKRAAAYVGHGRRVMPVGWSIDGTGGIARRRICLDGLEGVGEVGRKLESGN